jgi:hypothetical protein
MGVSEGVLAVRGRLADDDDDKGMMAVAVIHLSPRTELCACSCCFVAIVFHMLRC